MIKIQRALISCWDKTGLLPLAKNLAAFGIEIISSGGTARYLTENGLKVTAVEALTGSPEVLGGRVKTLHPKIHAGILSTRSEAHLADLQKIGAGPIELVIVNLYPFIEEAIEKALPLEKAIEYIDIGGPTLLRGAAKNYRHCLALHHPDSYESFNTLLNEHQGKVPLDFSLESARKVFFYTSWYDGQIQNYLGQSLPTEGAGQYQSIHLEKHADLRYGENPHQQAAAYRPAYQADSGLMAMTQLWGKPLSFNNYIDVQAAYAVAVDFDMPAVAIIKHTNPCGMAVHDDNLAEAFDGALRGDSLSAFGGIVACNRAVDEETAGRMAKIFFECIIAPDFEPAALEIFKKKKNLRLLKLPAADFKSNMPELKSLNGAFLLQDMDPPAEKSRENWTVATKKQPDDALWKELAFAWKVSKHVKSNAIVFTGDREVYGVGAGQMSRVDSVKIAAMKAEQGKRNLKGAIMASDAFFPFRDGIDAAAQKGIVAIIQPGGSIRDEEVIAAADEHGITMVFTGRRHFKH